jgi:putative glutamine amidotransferase
MPAPLIGLTASFSPASDGRPGAVTVGEAYIQAVLRAGGLPVVIPVGLSEAEYTALFSHLDGILLTGGGDIAPGLFQGAPHPRVYGIDERRDRLEIGLVKLAAERGKPFLGICRGVQVINVALGGTLYTHIADQLDRADRHDYFPGYPRDLLAHAVSIDPRSRLAGCLGGAYFEVNSLHHQGIERLAAPLAAVARAADTLIEGVELPEHPFGLGVQWHPECLQEHIPQRQLFQGLVQAASRAAAAGGRRSPEG